MSGTTEQANEQPANGSNGKRDTPDDTSGYSGLSPREGGKKARMEKPGTYVSMFRRQDVAEFRVECPFPPDKSVCFAIESTTFITVNLTSLLFLYMCELLHRQ